MYFCMPPGVQVVSFFVGCGQPGFASAGEVALSFFLLG
jgi:hypothetical protein